MARNCGECLIEAVEVVELPENGVCPRCSTNYGPEPAQDFEAALQAFIQVCSEVTDAHLRRTYPNSAFARDYEFTAERGQKFVRIVRNDHTQRSVHAFVRVSDGAILHPAGYKKPFIAKGGPNCAQTVRGSIFAPDHGRSAVGPWGVKHVK